MRTWLEAELKNEILYNLNEMNMEEKTENLDKDFDSVKRVSESSA